MTTGRNSSNRQGVEMSAINLRRSATQEVRASERDQNRGYSLNYKQVGLAFAIEIVVVIVSLIGAAIMANKYGRTTTDYVLMMLAPVAYAMVELTRVPLALATRTQKSHFMKAVAAFAVLCAAGVTVKSMSMLGEIMFRPRLEAVAEAKRYLEKVNHDRDSIAYTIRSADDLVAQRKSEREAAEQQLSKLAAEMGKHPGQVCSQVFGTDKNGKDYRGQKCTSDPATLALNQQLHSASEDRAEASRKLEEANAKRAALSLTSFDKLTTDAEANYRDALFHSQLHSFTSMVFGKDPNHVTENEIASFLRVFVFLPAIFVALASTLLAMTAVNHIKPKVNNEPVVVPDAAVVQILRAAVQSADAELGSAKQMAARTFGHTEGGPQRHSSLGQTNEGAADVINLRQRMEMA
jgi:hypothetical protein